MAKINQVFMRQLEETESRYRKLRKAAVSDDGEQKQEEDWRRVETSKRVLRRMMALGMHDLAGAMLEQKADTRKVASAVHPGQDVSLLERIIEENDLLSSRFLHNGSVVSRAVGRILIRSRGRTVGYGTGFMVSARLLMTNNHVLDNRASTLRSRIEFDYYERRNGQTGPTIPYELDPDTFFMTDKALDFTLVAVSPGGPGQSPPSQRGWIRLIPESGKALVGEPVNVIQHPNGRPQQIAIKNNHITDRVDDFLHYVADTQPGSSGSPVMNMQWELAALHHSGVPKKDDQNRILLRDGAIWNGNRADVDRIDWVANEGIRISRIVRHVKGKLDKSSRQMRDLFDQALAEAPPPPVWPPPSAAMVPETVPAVKEMELDDDTLDRLTSEEIASIVARTEHRALEITREATTPGIVLVSEGDSWFDYSIVGMDIITCLRKFYDYNIHNVACPGDTLDNMAWGTRYDRKWKREEPPLEQTLEAIRGFAPRIVLLSGGGNDITGEDLGSFLNHKASGLDALRQPYTDETITSYFRTAFMYIIDRIWQIDSAIHVVLHGYGHPVPDGRGIINFLGFSFVGPWLRPALVAKGYEQEAERCAIVHHLIDKLNDMLAEMAANDTAGRIHYIDLRSMIRRRDWDNELHLKNSAFRRVAGRFDQEIRSILSQPSTALRVA